MRHRIAGRVAGGALVLVASLAVAAGAQGKKEKTVPVKIEAYRSYKGQSARDFSWRKGYSEPGYLDFHTNGAKQIDAASVTYRCPKQKFMRLAILTHDRVPDYVPVPFVGRKFKATWTGEWYAPSGAAHHGTNTVTIRGTVLKRRPVFDHDDSVRWFANATYRVKDGACTVGPVRVQVAIDEKTVDPGY